MLLKEGQQHLTNIQERKLLISGQWQAIGCQAIRKKPFDPQLHHTWKRVTMRTKAPHLDTSYEEKLKHNTKVMFFLNSNHHDYIYETKINMS